MIKFVVMAETTEVSAIVKAFPSMEEANAYGHDLNARLKMIGLRAKWGEYKPGFAIPDNTKHRRY